MTNQSPLSEADQRFIAARRHRNRFGWLGLLVALVLVVGAWASLFFLAPLLVNPWELIRRLEQQTLEPGTLATMAVVAQALMNVLFLLLLSMVAAILSWAWLERRYMKVVDKLIAASVAPTRSSPSPPPAAGKGPVPPEQPSPPKDA
jgi:predicted ABC-type sugar transport system permease subunit